VLYEVGMTELFFQFVAMLLPHGWALHAWTVFSVVGKKASQIL